MKNLYQIASKFQTRLKLADEDVEKYLYLAPESEPRQFSSKKTPTQFLDRTTNFITPLIRNFRLDLTETTAEIKNLLQNALVSQTQINNFVAALELADQNLTTINRNLAIAQKNNNERSKLVSAAKEMLPSILPAIQKAKKLSDFSLAIRLLNDLSNDVSNLDNSEQALIKAQEKLQTIYEMS